MREKESVKLSIGCKLVQKRWYKVSSKSGHKLVRGRQYKVIKRWCEREVIEEQTKYRQRRRKSYNKQYYKEPEYYRPAMNSGCCTESDCSTSLETISSGISYTDDLDLYSEDYSSVNEFIDIPREDCRIEEKSLSYNSFSYLSDCWEEYNKEGWEEEIFCMDDREKEYSLQKISFSDRMKDEFVVRSKL